MYTAPNRVFAVDSTSGRPGCQSVALQMSPTPITSTSSGVGVQRSGLPLSPSPA